MNKCTTVGLDIAKNVFHALGVDDDNEQQFRRKIRRAQMNNFFSKLEPCLIILEACGSANYWARRFQQMGHEVKLLPPQHVKAYLRGQKNDFNDALALIEAHSHGRIRSVAIKSQAAQEVAVGMPITQHPPRRSQRALLTHWAPTLSIWRQTALQGRHEQYVASEVYGL